ncbi:GMC family oxidoreductase [Pseudorhizobium endolithicum]|uniref:GMC family oxidoreductase n=1 Tax=Pseudorhizobium endolithicum TaxID=1191678 RepID=A0ABM8PMT5_9HYPH|nr:GMC oxidoreductase [Pseudorhizobium endolithicum]CAD7038400.1 GMC family oxidoreductase [Pseudorhizobium endolithicum]
MIVSEALVPLPSADVCIVGAGPVGLSLAFKLEALGRTVLLLEAGPTDGRDAPDPAATGFVNRNHASPGDASHRGLGGTSALWGGRCVPYDDLDFQPRNHVTSPGWPIPHSEMSKYYGEAAVFLQCSSPTFARNVPEEGEDIITDAVEWWSKSPALGRVYEDRLRRSDLITVVTKAVVHDINLGPGGRDVESLHVKHAGRSRTLRAKQFVLAAGGLETARMLLSLQKQHPQKLGGPEGPLGRYYQGHLTGYIAVAHLNDKALLQTLSFRSDEQGGRHRRRLQVSPQRQMQDRLLNAVFWLDPMSISDPSHGSGTLSLLYLLLVASGTYRFLSRGLAPRSHGESSGEMRRHLRNIGVGGTSFSAFFRSLYRLYRSADSALENPAGRYLLRYHAEQMPNPESRVTIPGGADEDMLSVDYRVTEEDVASVLRSHEILDAWLRHRNAGWLEYLHPEPAMRKKAVLNQAVDGYHQIGHIRMSRDPGDGVVDQHCRVHDLENLHAAGAGVFSTGGHANPTLPAVALALRLGERLASVLTSEGREAGLPAKELPA